MANHVPVVVVGGGPAGLAMSAQLAANGVDHVVLERGEVANSWRAERWDSLRLLTPNWMTSIADHRYTGDDPDGFMRTAQLLEFFDGYCRAAAPPVHTHVTVERVTSTADGFEVASDAGHWRCNAVVAATGGSSEPRIPPVAAALPGHVQQLSALDYRNPAQLASGGAVLVVGASASGVQIADELARAGRAVTIAVGEHVRLPRSYRGRDIYWWLDAIGQLDERWHDVDDINRARRHASIQVVGSEDRHDVDLQSLRDRGVRLIGRVAAISGNVMQCSGGLGSLVANADLKQQRMLDRIDEYVESAGLAGVVGPPERPDRTNTDGTRTDIDMHGVGTVVWATGYRPSYSWLDSAAFDARGRVAHEGGVGRMPGLYLLGLPFLRRRRSNLLAGLGVDAAELFPHLRAHLDGAARRRTSITV